MKIYPSVQSERRLQYEVASADTLPCLGERRIEVWTEGAESPKAMAIQVAYVHKPLLSLSRCADMWFELRSGKDYEASVDIETGEITPLLAKETSTCFECGLEVQFVMVRHLAGRGSTC